MEVPAGTLVMWSDIGCPWATLATHRFHRTRDELGLADRVRLVPRAFPLELFNQRPSSKTTHDAELPVVAELAPAFGFRTWAAPPAHYPVSTLPALEAVQAAARQSAAAAEELDLGLRRAFFADSRCITLRNVVLDVAGTCPAVDADVLAGDLDAGTARGAVIGQWHEAEASEEIQGSPHVFAPGGIDAANPGITLHWEGKASEGGGPIIDHDDPTAWVELLRAAALP